MEEKIFLYNWRKVLKKLYARYISNLEQSWFFYFIQDFSYKYIKNMWKFIRFFIEILLFLFLDSSINVHIGISLASLSHHNQT